MAWESLTIFYNKAAYGCPTFNFECPIQWIDNSCIEISNKEDDKCPNKQLIALDIY